MLWTVVVLLIFLSCFCDRLSWNIHILLSGFHMEHRCMGFWARNHFIIPVTPLGFGCPPWWKSIGCPCWYHSALWGMQQYVILKPFICGMLTNLCLELNDCLLWQIDLRQESTIKFSASSAYPVITFGPFNTPSDVMTSLSHAIGISIMS